MFSSVFGIMSEIVFTTQLKPKFCLWLSTALDTQRWSMTLNNTLRGAVNRSAVIVQNIVSAIAEILHA